jgi:NitT/TauT family transport system substrate-binding protein
VILDVLVVEPKHLGLHPDALLAQDKGWQAARSAGAVRTARSSTDNLPPLLEQIRQVLYANGIIPANTPLPATDYAIARGVAKVR